MSLSQNTGEYQVYDLNDELITIVKGHPIPREKEHIYLMSSDKEKSIARKVLLVDYVPTQERYIDGGHVVVEMDICVYVNCFLHELDDRYGYKK